VTDGRTPLSFAGDDDVLEVLAASLGPAADVEPTWAEVSALHRVLDSAAAGRGVRTPLWRVRRPLSAVAAGALLLAGAGTAAAVTGAVIPEPVRVAARAVGLPLESPALAEARSALAHLRAALAANPRNPATISAIAQAVRNEVGSLSADDRSHVQAEATFLLAEADRALAPPPALTGAAAGPAPATPAPAPPAPASGSTPVSQPGDDHGGQSARPAPDAAKGDGSNDHSGSPSSGPGPAPGSGSDDGHQALTPAPSDSSGPGPGSSGSPDGHPESSGHGGSGHGPSGHD
jgi:hypothetical protein